MEDTGKINADMTQLDILHAVTQHTRSSSRVETLNSSRPKCFSYLDTHAHLGFKDLELL